MTPFLQQLTTSPRERRKAVTAQFHAAYGDVLQPLALCEGFEIVAANTAFARGLRLSAPVAGKMLNDHLPGLDAHEKLFGMEGHKATIQTTTGLYQLHGRRWSIMPHVTLLELTDLTHHHETAQALHRAQTSDPQTGLMLASAFQTAVERLFETHQRVWLGTIRLPVNIPASPAQPDWDCEEEHETRLDRLMSLSDRLIHDLGEGIVLGLGPCQHSIVVACPLPHAHENVEEEARHGLRQLARIARRCLNDGDAQKRAAVGLAIYPDHGQTAPEVFQALGLTAEKSEKEQEPVLFEADLTVQKNRRIALSDDFSTALSNGAITPHYQPVIHAQSGRLLSFEALIRWVHPQLGYVIPPDIVAIARARKMLAPLTYAVMEHCLEELRRWPERVSFAINVLPEQLTGELVDMVREAVRRARIDPARLEIEITEDALIENFDRSQRIIARLRAIGVSVAMDDFGAGFTSLSNLTKLSVTKIKIDKSIADGLPHDPKACAVVRSILHLGSELDVSITVEGIESEDQLALLRPYDCGIQGYVHSKPLPPERLLELSHFLAKEESVAPNR
ncbi:MAG: EAL domain-containing protein [Pseudomonadota bacterium]